MRRKAIGVCAVVLWSVFSLLMGSAEALEQSKFKEEIKRLMLSSGGYSNEELNSEVFDMLFLENYDLYLKGEDLSKDRGAGSDLEKKLNSGILFVWPQVKDPGDIPLLPISSDVSGDK